MAIVKDPPIRSLSAVADLLGVNRSTVADLCRTLGIEPFPIGPAKGLTPDQIERIRKALGIVKG